MPYLTIRHSVFTEKWGMYYAIRELYLDISTPADETTTLPQESGTSYPVTCRHIP